MELNARALHAELRARAATIQELLDSNEDLDKRRLLRLIASLDYHQRLLFSEINPEPNGPRSVARIILRRSPGELAFAAIVGFLAWAVAKGYEIPQFISWLLR